MFFAPGDQCFQVTGFHLLGGHSLFERRKLENDPQDGSHCPVTEQSTVVKDQVLQLTSFDRHLHGSMGGIDRGDDPFGSRY